MALCNRCKSEAETSGYLGSPDGARDTDTPIGLPEGDACDRCGLSPSDTNPAQ